MNNIKKILITGGKGYIARNLKPLFEAHEYDVMCPSRYDLDLLNRDHLDSYLRLHQFDAVIHTATKGGKRNVIDTFEEVYIPNIEMFNNLTGCLSWKNTPIITFGSGAEFDRRMNISSVYENNIHTYWPIDPYGLSKNIITRKSLFNLSNVRVLRLFGCFNHDENPERFIKSAILNIQKGLPIEIHQNKMMDFFYLEDVFRVIDYILKTPNDTTRLHLNLVYPDKFDLFTIANVIQRYTKNYNSSIRIINKNKGLDYTGSGTLLSKLPINLVGLEEGIRKTCNKLLL